MIARRGISNPVYLKKRSPRVRRPRGPMGMHSDNNNITEHIPVFHIEGRTNANFTLLDIEDLLETSYSMSHEAKEQHFQSHGINYENVDKYYHFVGTLEKSFTKQSTEESCIFARLKKMMSYYWPSW